MPKRISSERYDARIECFEGLGSEKSGNLVFRLPLAAFGQDIRIRQPCHLDHDIPNWQTLAVRREVDLRIG